MFIRHCTVYSVQCTLYICLLCITHCTMYIVHCIMYSEQSVLCTASSRGIYTEDTTYLSVILAHSLSSSSPVYTVYYSDILHRHICPLSSSHALLSLSPIPQKSLLLLPSIYLISHLLSLSSKIPTPPSFFPSNFTSTYNSHTICSLLTSPSLHLV